MIQSLRFFACLLGLASARRVSMSKGFASNDGNRAFADLLLASQPEVAFAMSNLNARPVSRATAPNMEEAVKVSPKQVKELRDMTSAGMQTCKKALEEAGGDMKKAAEILRAKGIAGAAKRAGRDSKEGRIVKYIHGGAQLGIMLEMNSETDFVAKNARFGDLSEKIAQTIVAYPSVEFVKKEDVPEAWVEEQKKELMKAEDLEGKPDNVKEKIVSGRVEKKMKEAILLDQPYVFDPEMTVREFVEAEAGLVGENIQVGRFLKFEVGGGAQDDEDEEPKMSYAEEVKAMGDEVAADVAAAPAPAPEPAPAPAEEKTDDGEAYNPGILEVKKLREATQQGIGDCKKALIEAKGDMKAAESLLRAKGMKILAKRAGKAAKEGIIEVYIHGGAQMGIMVELNAETDFVARTPEFKKLASDIATAIAATPSVKAVDQDSIPQEVIDDERRQLGDAEDLQGKPDNIKEKIVDGRLAKALKDMSLLDAEYFLDPEKTVRDVVQDFAGKFGENMKVARFEKFEIGR